MKFIKIITMFLVIVLLLSNFAMANLPTLNESALNNSNISIYENLSNISQFNKTYNITPDITDSANLSNMADNLSNTTENLENESNEDTHYLNVLVEGYKVIVKTNGIPYGFANGTTLNFINTSNGTYIVSPVILNIPIEIYAKFDNETSNKTIFLNYTKKYEIKNKTVIIKDIYFPSEKIIIKTNFKPNNAYIITPNNKIINLKIHKEGKNYSLSTKLNKDIILGNYTVVIDKFKKSFVVDYYKINADFNNSCIFGNVSYYVKKPKYVKFIVYPSKKKINISLTNGNFNISLIHLSNMLNISKIEKIEILYGNAKQKMHIPINVKNKKKIKKLVSYDPISKEIVINLEGSNKEIEKTIEKYRKEKKYSILKIEQINNNYEVIEIRIKADKKILNEYNFPMGILNTTANEKKIDNTKIRVEVNNKLDDVWYKFSCKIPKGYGVKKIVRDDGIAIFNNISINRTTGEVIGNIRWYIENNTLYFYDDPVYGYDISLTPPKPNNSIAVELSYDGQSDGGCGQISAIIFPYNEGDNSSTIASYDHAGRTGDNNYANNIDADAGSKIAIRYTVNTRTRQYGNGGDNFETASRYLSEINRTDIALNTVPNGILESLILTDMYAPWNNKNLNITQKVIIRGNNKWFATIYYVKNPTTKNYNDLRFFQGMDWNFDGSYQNDNAYYNGSDDIVYGYDSNAPVDNIQYGGFKSNIPSYAHDVNYYGYMWNDISNNNLNNASSYIGDAGTALSWSKNSLASGDIWVIPIIWGLGYNYSDMINDINIGLNELYDAGVKSIDYPNNGDSFNPNIQKIIYVNSTIALYGLVDAYNLNVSINMSQINGTYSYSNFTLINLSVPHNEEKKISFPINISNIPYGKYNISIKTNLPNDQNSSNDEKSIVVYISSFSITPSYQEKIGNDGDEIYYNITVNNNGGGDKFDINITNSTKGWVTKIYNNSFLIAEDSSGDGNWNYIASGYDSNSNNLPDVYIPNGKLNLTVLKEIPLTTPLGEVDLTKLKFIQISNPLIYDDVSFQTSTPYPPSVKKTFYLHGNSLKTLNTSVPLKSNNYTIIDGNSLSSWYQYPVFADDFVITSKIPILLYVDDPSGTNSHDVVVSIIATDGSSSFTLGSDKETILLNNNINPYIFNISLSSITTIPKDYYLVLRVENQNSQSPINVYHDSAHISNITLNTTTYVKVNNIFTDKTVYYSGDNASIFANITDPIGSYDISGANITVFYPNGTMYLKDSMDLQEVDGIYPSFWKLYNYSFNLPVSGTYNISITGIESNGVIYNSNYSVKVIPKIIKGTIYEDLGVLGEYDKNDSPISNVNVSLVKDTNANGILDINDSFIENTTTNSSGGFNFTVNGDGIYFIVVNSKTVNTTRGLNSGYTINNIWAEETYQTNDSNYSQVIPFFGGRNATKSDDWGNRVYEHYVKINTSKYNSSKNNILFGFSFDVVVNTKDTDDDSSSNRYAQGTLRQFIENANAINGANHMYFIPMVNPNENDGSGKWWSVALNKKLPIIMDNITTIDGTAYFPNMTVRDSNPGQIGTGGTVGVGPDGVPNTGDEPTLPRFDKLELEVNGSGSSYTFKIGNGTINPSNVTIRKIAMINSGDGIEVQGGCNNFLIEKNIIGVRANGSYPPINNNITKEGIVIYDNTLPNIGGIIQRNYIGYCGRYDIGLGKSTTTGNEPLKTLVRWNEVFDAGRDSNYQYPDAIAVYADNITVEENLIYMGSGTNPRSAGKGVEIRYGSENVDIIENTIFNTASAGILFDDDSNNGVVKYNIIHDCGKNYTTAGVVVSRYSGSPINITISKNSMYNNSGLGIDLDNINKTAGDGITANDGFIYSSQANYGVDYPIITYAKLNSTKLYIEGHVGNDSGSSAFANTSIEIYLVKNSSGGDNLIGNNISSNGSVLDNHYGEGWIYQGSLTADNNGNFNGTINISGRGVEKGCLITATTTLKGKGTSEFGPDYLLIKRINISAGLSAILEDNHINISITVKSYNDVSNVYVYWVKPNNSNVTNVSGYFNKFNNTNNVYRFKFNDISGGEIKKINIILNISENCRVSDAYNLGIDPPN
ncbi:right-handed parallel beta-helix repeat-containing protein [Methanococcus aeolicus]|uniref:hypothetical protein n=1 Tax=Methanococcus aeolicus TaxID=42879 RepID=UPI0021C874CB|nr:hypothetical protein [Methanococcus aeolicus]UXM84644.1 hypothetical protein N6C89_07880 [Methanococcus aeolicus]